MSNSNRSYYREQQLLAIHKDRKRIEAAAVDRGFALTIANGLQHWTFARKGKLIDWWPGSGKVAVDKDFDARQRADKAEAIIALLEQHKAPPRLEAPPERRSVLAPSNAVATALAAFDFDGAAALLKRRPETLQQTARMILDGCRLAPGSTVLCGGVTATRGADGGLTLAMTAAVDVAKGRARA